ncbi:MAG: peptidoglycan-associated lipoprotein Pal [Bdellovibrionales bacterium]|nr:peptidoglycan-associated lipoprotein Pal [Bdellovibrionales bacterium]
MSRVRSVLLFSSLALLCACSKSGRGGTGSPDDAMGEGNIPLAEPGSELADVNFAYDSAALSSSAKNTLRENAQWLLDNPSTNVVVEGHCDERGTAEYNMALGLRRSQSVSDYLRSLGVSGSQLDQVSYGEELPLDPASNESAWSKNRRAHFSAK